MPVVGNQLESFSKWSLRRPVWSLCNLASVLQRQRCGPDARGDCWCLAVLQLVKVARVRREDGAGVHFRRVHVTVFSKGTWYHVCTAAVVSVVHVQWQEDRNWGDRSVMGERKLAAWRQNDHLHIKLTWESVEINHYPRAYTKERWRYNSLLDIVKETLEHRRDRRASEARQTGDAQVL